jgi:hypothetical protein
VDGVEVAGMVEPLIIHDQVVIEDDVFGPGELLEISLSY